MTRQEKKQGWGICHGRFVPESLFNVQYIVKSWLDATEYLPKVITPLL